MAKRHHKKLGCGKACKLNKKFAKQCAGKGRRAYRACIKAKWAKVK